MQSADPFVATLQEWIDVFMRRSMRDFFVYARRNGLSMSQNGALLHLSRQGTCGVTDIGDTLGVTSGAASQMLDRLVQHGLILRNEDPDDRRVKRITLTDEGQRVVHESIQARQAWFDDLAAVLSPGEKEQVTAALGILTDRARHLRPEVES
jgi:DNA-binding MarR family transcriptional regulator